MIRRERRDGGEGEERGSRREDRDRETDHSNFRNHSNMRFNARMRMMSQLHADTFGLPCCQRNQNACLPCCQGNQTHARGKLPHVHDIEPEPEMTLLKIFARKGTVASAEETCKRGGTSRTSLGTLHIIYVYYES